MGRWVGRLTAVNTLGAVLGALLTGYVVLPWLGSQRTLLAIALCFALAALLERRAAARARRAASALAALRAAAAARRCVSPRWDLARLTSGTNVYFDG